jgi:hypothetical protein
MQDYNFALGSVWEQYLVSDIKAERETEGVNAEEII